MTDLPRDLTPAVLQGHVLEVLRSLPGDSVHCVVTSPPYWGLRAYGTDPQVWGGDPAHAHEWAETAPRRSRSEGDATSEMETASVGGRNYEAQGGSLCGCGAWRGELGLEPTPDLFVSHLADVFDEVRRVLRPDGTLWMNLGDTYVGGGRGSGIHADGSESLSSRQFWSQNDDGQVPLAKPAACGLQAKQLVGIPWRVAFELQRRGWWLRSDCVWAKPNPMPERVRDRPARSHDYVFLLTKSARYFYDAYAVRVPVTGGAHPKNGGYSKKLAPAGSGIKNNDSFGIAISGDLPAENGANLKSVWWIATQPYPEAHFATYPEELVERAILAGTSARGACAECGASWTRDTDVDYVIHSETNGGTGRARAGFRTMRTIGGDRLTQNAATSPGGWAELPNSSKVVHTLGWLPGCEHGRDPVPCLVLDPFCGSGTSLWVARSLGRRAVGIELKPEYVALALRRCRANVPSLDRFSGEAAT